ncbi:LysR family transcriptional regulator [Brucella sp. BE17]|uniref:LysR family transcriptional regulator n=1 Tax=Brucella sp. BE17 TaxID=3142977 RepID=UPI0031BBC849
MARPYDLPSVTALVCFEAAARNLSFKQAAGELNVTPAAISHQIKALENDLCCALFTRRSKGVELTQNGALLFVALQRGFETISDATSQIRDHPQKVDVTIRSTSAVSALWLTPRISAFWKIHPEITIAQIVSDVPSPASRCDLSIHYGEPRAEDGVYRTLFQDRIIAAGSPEFASQHAISSLADLLNVPLIHSSGEGNSWTQWPDWLVALRQPSGKGRNFYVSNYMIALQTAQDDIGAVLGWDGLIAKLIEDGKLVQLVPDSISSPAAFHLKIHPRATKRAHVFADWLVESIA